jgi:hypothetical protein
MDLLDNFKEHWQNATADDSERISEQQIRQMLAKKSSGITKWIFFLGIAEFVFFTSLGIIFYDAEDMESFRDSGVWTEYLIYSITHYVIVVVFIYLFYRNYRRINVVQPTKQLMKSILRVRKTMNYYVWFNVLSTLIVITILSLYIAFNDPKFDGVIAQATENGDLWKLYGISFLVAFGSALVFSGVLWLFYRLLYGILLKRLKRNYKELSRMEM